MKDPPLDAIQRMINAHLKYDGFLDVKQITISVLIILFAAQTNTAVLTSWTLLYLLYYPEVLKKVKEEREAVAKISSDPYSYKILSQLKYFSNCIYEAMRLCMFAPGWRAVVQPVKIRNYHLPKDTLIITSYGHLNMNPKVYDDVQSYKPERFFNETVPVYVFGSGKHPCVGQKMALLEIKLIVSYILDHYDMEVPTELPQVDITNIHGVWPKVKPLLRYRRKEV
eukprot:TRINITY_DN5782_c0_g1_i3.p1 TRINITY_DN5782_c0_g1~~TRINITY_DN5782_c0_g1_i3.p1  ORF type:complete len:225 (+),score=25.18 TRINITY_DN5782_c0_g1_i3:63-737(+)